MRTIAAHRYVSPRNRALTPEEQDVRAIAYAMKTCDPHALATAASDMAHMIDGPCWLIPVPSSKGDTKANATLAAAIAVHVPGARVSDQLRRLKPVPSQCERHKRKLPPLRPHQHGIVRRGKPLTAQAVYLVDNVTTSGNTLLACHRAMGFGTGLVFADASPTI